MPGLSSASISVIAEEAAVMTCFAEEFMEVILDLLM